MIAIGYIAMFAVGIILGLIGGGGAILTMPILVYLFGVSPTLATSYSLFIVGFTSVFGVWRYHRDGLVDYRLAVFFLVPSLLGTYVARHVLLPAIPDVLMSVQGYTLGREQLIMLVFALVMLAASLSMIFIQVKDVHGHANIAKTKFKLALLGFGVGFVAGFVGAGGGFLIIPALVVIGGVAITSAIPTSLFIIATNSLVAFFGDLIASRSVDWSFLLLTALAAVFGLFLGVRLSRLISPNTLKTGFGWFVLVMAIWILGKQIL